VFTREDGSPLRPEWISTRFQSLSAKAGLPPSRFHDLRHGAATMLQAAGVDIKVISKMLGHATYAFTADVCTEVAEELAAAAADAIAAFIPRRAKTVPTGAVMIFDTRRGTLPLRHSACSWAEARGFEPRMGANPNRISSAAP
jgi:Phage integrase family